MKIIFKNQDNSIGIITPTDDVIYRLNGLIYIDNTGREQYKEVSNEEWIEAVKYAIPLVAEKDVPLPYKYPVEWTIYINEDTGEEEIDEITKYEIYHTPYWIVDDSTIPTDRTFRDCWEIDESFGKPDGFGGESNEFDEELLRAYYKEVNDNSKDMLLESQRLIDEQKLLSDSIKTTITQIEELVK